MEEHNILLDASSNELEVIEFYLTEILEDGSEYSSYFGMNVAKVLEIIRLPHTITSMPNRHHTAALGTFNLRDRVLPLVDLGVWLGKKIKESEGRKVIVSEFSEIVTAFIVSGVTNIHRISWDRVEPPGRYLQNLSHDSINGVVRFGERIVFLLDMEMIISSMNPKLSMEHSINLVDSPSETGKGHKVLVADDSSSIRKIITHVLGQAGYEVTQTSSGLEAWEQLCKWKDAVRETSKNIKEYVDLVVSDIEMPEMDGHTLTKNIKNDPELKKLPVVLFSSLISDVVRQKGIKVGANDQVSKPDLPGLAVRVKKLIDENS
ncbi:MAG: chemotaxis protein [Deltaproteobacteria bacterium]|jgi:two-component system chemotaxis response regulator CheV|nr:chemotaxis protein [Deltaproteobacteria bacterium]